MNKLKNILVVLAVIAFLTVSSSCKKCRECTAYDHNDKQVDYEEHCSASNTDLDTWEFNFRSHRLANNWKIVCNDK